MFKIFGKKGDAKQEPHPLKVNFARLLIPQMIRDSREGFIRTMVSDEAVKILAKGWKKFGEANLPIWDVIDPKGIEVIKFREEDLLIIVVVMPPANSPGEPLFAGAVLGPPEDGTWSGESMKSVPYRYFLSLEAEEGTEMEELKGETFEKLGPGPEPIVELFVEWIRNAAGRTAPVVSVPSEDEEMQLAIQKAKSSLTEITERFIAGELENFTVKVPVSDGELTEHFWLSDTQYSDGIFFGVIDAVPEVVSNIEEGQQYRAKFEDVTDWMHLSDGLIHGNFTLRVLLPRMPKEEAEKYAAVLAPEAV